MWLRLFENWTQTKQNKTKQKQTNKQANKQTNKQDIGAEGYPTLVANLSKLCVFPLFKKHKYHHINDVHTADGCHKTKTHYKTRQDSLFSCAPFDNSLMNS